MATLPALKPATIMSASNDLYYEFNAATNNDVVNLTAYNSYNLDTATQQSTTGSASELSNHRDVAFSYTGSLMYVSDQSDPDTIYKYTLSTSFDPSTETYTGDSFLLTGAGETSNAGIYISPDGTKLFTVGSINDNVVRYDMATPHVLSSITTSSSYQDPARVNPLRIFFRPDGTHFYVLYSPTYILFDYEITGSAWDITTAQPVATGSVLAGLFTSVGSFTISHDGIVAYVVKQYNDGELLIHTYIDKYTMPAWDVANMVIQTPTRVLNGGLESQYAICMSGGYNNDLYFYTMRGGGSEGIEWYLHDGGTYDLDDTPADFVTMTTPLSYEVELSLSQSVGYDIYGLDIRVLSSSLDYVLAGASASLADSWTNVTSSIFHATDVVYSGSFVYVDTAASKTDWDGAIVQLRQTYETGSYPTGLDLGTLTGASPTNANNSTYLSFNTDTTEVQSTALSNTPANFNNMDDGLTFDVTYNILGWKDDDFDLSMRITNGATILAAADSGGTYQTVANNIQNSADVSTGAITFGYTNQTASKSQWDAASIQLQQTWTKSKGGDNANIRIDYIAISGSYSAIDPETFIRVDHLFLTGSYSTGAGLNLKWNNVVWSNIANLDGVTAANIASVDGVS